jgi:hypothetical protein
MGKVLPDAKLISALFHKGLKTVSHNKNMERDDLVKFNEILDKLTVNRFFEYYSENIINIWPSSSYTVDPVAGEIMPIKDKDKVYFDKMA